MRDESSESNARPWLRGLASPTAQARSSVNFCSDDGYKSAELRRCTRRCCESPNARGAEPKEADVTVIGVWDDCIPAYLVPAYCHSAFLFWARRGGDRSVAKSAWIDRDATPMSDLEGLALGVLRAHLPDEAARDAVAGAEYWVQIRGGNGGGPGLGLHFDKDERAHAERDEWRHPMSPPRRISRTAARRSWSSTRHRMAKARPRGCLVAPRQARHVAFLGNLLHGVPRELTPRRDVRASENRMTS